VLVTHRVCGATYNTGGGSDVYSSLRWDGCRQEEDLVAKLTEDRDADVQERVIANTPSAVKKYFAPLAEKADVMATYEAGCFGFGLYRQLTEMGVAALVAAPG